MDTRQCKTSNGLKLVGVDNAALASSNCVRFPALPLPCHEVVQASLTMRCVLCSNFNTVHTLWDTDHLCGDCFRAYTEKRLTVYRARISSKRKSVQPLPSSTAFSITYFRKRARDASVDYNHPRMKPRCGTSQASYHHSRRYTSPPSDVASTEQLLAKPAENQHSPALFPLPTVSTFNLSTPPHPLSPQDLITTSDLLPTAPVAASTASPDELKCEWKSS